MGELKDVGDQNLFYKLFPFTVSCVHESIMITTLSSKSFSLGFKGPWILPLKIQSVGWSPQRSNMKVVLLPPHPHLVVETMKLFHVIHITLPWSRQTWALGNTSLMYAEWGMRLKKQRDQKKAGQDQRRRILKLCFNCSIISSVMGQHFQIPCFW